MADILSSSLVTVGQNIVTAINGLAASISSGWTNTRSAIGGTYTVLTSDIGKTLGFGGNAYYTISFGAASGYQPKFIVALINEDTTRAKLVSMSGAGGLTFYLWPLQTVIIFNDGGIWGILPRKQRWKLENSISVFVDNGGNDANDGLSSSVLNSGPFATLQRAYDVIAKYFDLEEIFGVTIIHANQTITDSLNIAEAWTGGGAIAINLGGGTWNPSVNANGGCMVLNCAVPGFLALQNGTLAPTTAPQHCVLAQVGTLTLSTGLTFGTCTGNFHIISQLGGLIQPSAAYNVSGNASGHLGCNSGGMINFVGAAFAVTIVGTPAFSDWAVATQGSKIIQNSAFYTYVNGASATGPRFFVNKVSIIETDGGGANFFPGNAAGTADGTTFGTYT